MAAQASHLLFSFNRWEKREEMLALLEKGVNIVCDRYAFSGVVYSVCNVRLAITYRVVTLTGANILTKDCFVLIL
jgi:thymidylate kinase